MGVLLWVFGGLLLHLGGAFFGTCTNVFLFSKAEIAVETRQVCFIAASWR
jgi:hypothetical protein